MAEELVDKVIAHKGFKHTTGCRTKKIKLLGGEGYHELLHVQLVQKYGISTEMAHHLCTTYGSTAFAVCELSRPTGATAGVHRFGKELVKGFPFMEEEVRTQYLPTVCLLCTLYSPSWRRRSVLSKFLVSTDVEEEAVRLPRAYCVLTVC